MYQSEPSIDHYLPTILHSELGLSSECKPSTASNVRRKKFGRNISESGWSGSFIAFE